VLYPPSKPPQISIQKLSRVPKIKQNTSGYAFREFFAPSPSYSGDFDTTDSASQLVRIVKNKEASSALGYCPILFVSPLLLAQQVTRFQMLIPPILVQYVRLGQLALSLGLYVVVSHNYLKYQDFA
jgi:hypothetical protein